MECTYKIYDCNLEAIQVKIEKLNKKAKKLNCQPIILDIIESDILPADKDGLVDKIYYITITGKAPIINNWEFIGTIEQHKAGNIIKVIPGNTFPERYKNIGNTCEHCNTNRQRKDTYLVRNVITDEYKAVGKSCLKDFTGHSNPQSYADYMEYLADTSWLELMNEPPTGGHAERGLELNTYLAHVAYQIRNNGWTSRTKARESEAHITSTADMAINGMFPFRPQDKIYPSDSDYELSEKSIEWAKQLIDTDNNNYLYTINIIALDEWTNFKNTGFAASIVSSYIRHIERQIEQEKKATAAKEQSISNYVGEIKQRKDFTLTYVTFYSFESDFGTTWIHKFMDENGNIFIWKTNKALADIEQGSDITIKGTIKDHVEFRGEKQTHITRCKVLN